MTIRLPDARSLSDRELSCLRQRAIRGCEMGLPQKELAQLLGVAQETISRWWTTYCAEGIEGLPGDRTGRPVGSGRTLSEEQAIHLQDLIDHHNPEELGIAAPLWNRRAVRQLIRNETGIVMPVRTVGEYLKRWGYTCKKPSRHARKQDPQEVQRWLEETYPEVEQKATEEEAEIFFCDETGVAADAYPGYGYARRGERATLEVPDPHVRINVISAISTQGTLRFMTYSGSMNAEVFLRFLQRLVHCSPRKIYLIVDRLRAHDATKVWAWLMEHEDQIEMILMPRRAPELNPDEYLNQDLKGNVHAQGLPADKQELRHSIQSFLRRLLHRAARVVSYFFHPCAQYALGT